MWVNMKIISVVLGHNVLEEDVYQELYRGLGGVTEILCASTAEEVITVLDKDPEVVVPLLTLLPIPGSLDEALETLHKHPAFEHARTMIITNKDVLRDISQAMDRGLIDAIYTNPWRTGALGRQAQLIIIQYLMKFMPDYPLTQELVQGHYQPVKRRSSRLLRFQEMPESEVVERMLVGIEKVLGPRPRVILPVGTRLTRQDHIVDTFFLSTRGAVALERSTPYGSIVMHHNSTGPIVGIISFGQRRTAFFTSRATAELEGIFLTIEQIDRVLDAEPMVSAAVAALAIRSLDRRLRRSEQIQMEKTELNAQLQKERAQLQSTLVELESTREELVSRERFATLGELSAGVAHELNNPVAALQRATEHLEEDVHKLVSSHAQAEFVNEALQNARSRQALSTRDERQLRRQLTNSLGDRGTAHRLVAAGITDLEHGLSLAQLSEEDFALLETGAGIGSSLRNLEMSSNRIRRLVQSLKAYSRPDDTPVEGIDINQSIDDTLRLTKHRLGNIEVESHFEDLPLVRCHPGQIDQVWTNVIVNSADALHGEGKIIIETDVISPSLIRVRITDNGANGIDPKVLPRIFEPRFTTKQGRVSFGIGMGISLVKAIVERHNGSIEMSSRPGKTQTTVILPVDGPDCEEIS